MHATVISTIKYIYTLSRKAYEALERIALFNIRSPNTEGLAESHYRIYRYSKMYKQAHKPSNHTHIKEQKYNTCTEIRKKIASICANTYKHSTHAKTRQLQTAWREQTAVGLRGEPNAYQTGRYRWQPKG